MSPPFSSSPSPSAAAGAAGTVESGPAPFSARYRELVFASVALTLLVIGVLFLNAYVARQLQDDATSVNIAGRQRMLSQRLAKAAVYLRDQFNGNQPINTSLAELRTSKILFETTLATFRNGGRMEGTTPESTVVLPAAQSEAGKKLLADADLHWQKMEPPLQRVISAKVPLREDVLDLVKQTMDNNLALTASMNDFTNELAALSSARASRLRWIQAGALAGVLGLLTYMAYFFIGKLRKSDTLQTEAAARLREINASLEGSTLKLNGLLQENALILSTVKQGLLVIDSKFRIGNTYSKECESILRVESLAGINFLGLLQRLLTEKMYATTRDFLDLMFNPAKKEKQLAKINPLSQVDFNFPNNEGGFDTRFLEFEFRRVMDGKDTVSRVFVSARDITERVLLEKQLREVEQRKDRQFEILSSVLHVEPADFREFVETTERELQTVNDTLRADSLVEASRGSGGQDELRQRLNNIFRAAHGIKGNAEFIGARYFVQAVHDFEDKITEIRDRPSLKPEDLLSVVILQASLIADLEEARELVGRLGSLRGFIHRPTPPVAPPAPAPAPVAPVTPAITLIDTPPVEAPSPFATLPPPQAAPPAPVIAPAPTAAVTVRRPPASPDPSTSALPGERTDDSLLGSFRTMIQTLANNLGKQVQIQAEGFREELMGDQRTLIRDILVQLGRNSLVHGLESPVERLASGKSMRGTLTLTLQTPGGSANQGFNLIYRDDGRGLDPARIRARAIASRIATPTQMAAMDDSEVVLLIFEPGFSTADKIDENSGRGVGLDLLRQKVVDDLGGEISLDSQPGRFCGFHFVVPPVTASVTGSMIDGL